MECAGGAGHQRACFADRLAVVPALQLRQRLAALANQRGDAVQDGGALVRLDIAPVRPLPGGVRGGYGGVDIIQACRGEFGRDTAIGRVVRGIDLAATAAPFAADVNRFYRAHVQSARFKYSALDDLLQITCFR